MGIDWYHQGDRLTNAGGAGCAKARTGQGFAAWGQLMESNLIISSHNQAIAHRRSS
jgi:hypothetical protein